MKKSQVHSANKQLKNVEKMARKNPNNASYRLKLGVLLTDQRLFESAKKELEEAIELKEDNYEAYSVLGKVLYNLGDYVGAINKLQKSLEIKPGFHKSEHYLSYLLYKSNNPKEALCHIEEACRQQPRHAGYLITYGNILEALHRYEEAVEKLSASLAIEPDKYYAWNNLGNLFKQLGKMEDSLYYYDQAFKVNPKSDVSFSNKITALHYIPNISLDKIVEECKVWDDYFSSERFECPKISETEKDRKLRIGMISDGFRRHPVGYMITSTIEELKKYNFELFFYTTNYDSDSITERLKKTAKKWQVISQLGIEQTANLIKSDKVDILIDLAGHNSGNRMMAIAKKPSPIVVKWVGGLINTTGVKAIDYLISDSVETPCLVDDYYTEKLIRMPDDYICYDPPVYAPNIASLPALGNGYITFGCFNNPTKINSEIVACWSKILLAIPNSRFF